jgi:hypothetical protein
VKSIGRLGDLRSILLDDFEVYDFHVERLIETCGEQAEVHLSGLGRWGTARLHVEGASRSSLINKAAARAVVKRLLPDDVPPINASFLFYLFLDAKNCDALVGDLEERYKLIHKQFGVRRANFWYWTQTVTSIAPIVWAAMKRVTKAATGVAALVELYRKIRS